jgi:hypothetical protein
MTQPSEGLLQSFAAHLDKNARSEIRIWGMLAAGSLAIAGLFALLLAFSRIPYTENLIAWPAGFFGKGLVIHVVFSFVVWFLACFALLCSLASFQLAGGARLRLAWLGRVGPALVTLAFPLLFLPAFESAGEASLNNYIPVIIGPLYYAGLGVLALGVLAAVLRLFANTRGKWRDQSPFVIAMLGAGFIYILALVMIAQSAFHVIGDEPSQALNEDLFWSGGHVLQILNTALLVIGWSLLLRLSIGADAINANLEKIAAILLLLFALPSPFIFDSFETFSFEQQKAFTDAKMLLGIPVALIAIGALPVFARRAGKGWPWKNTAFLAAMLAPPVFAAGGILGFFVDGADTRTPAHYHGVIAGVNLVLMGLFLEFILPLIARPPSGKRLIRLQLYLFGIGQFIACIGLFWAGGYGAARKTAGAAQGLEDGAMIGMALNGIGALIAVIGGVMFIWTVLKALLKRNPGP